MYVRVQKYLLLQKKKKKFSETSRWFPCFPNFKWLNCCGLSVYTVLFIFTHCNSSEQLTVKHKVCKIILNIYFISYLFIYFFACAYFHCGLLTCTNKKKLYSKVEAVNSIKWRLKNKAQEFCCIMLHNCISMVEVEVSHSDAQHHVTLCHFVIFMLIE